jgi:DNA-binding transcriptional ArsR family regulator
MLQALGAPRRREILRLVWEQERAAGAIHGSMPDVSFGAVSQHLRVLEDAGLVTRRQAGRFRYYRAQRETLGPLKEWLETMWDDALGRLKLRAELEQARRGPRPKRPRGIGTHAAGRRARWRQSR